MSTSESLHVLRRANPRTEAGFARSVEAAGDAVRARIVASAAPVPRVGAVSKRARLARVSAAGALLAAAVVIAAFLTVGSPGGTGLADAAAAVKHAATVTAVSAERSGTAVVRITHNGEVWAGTTIRWHGGDLAVSQDRPRRPGKTGPMLLVEGVLYGVDSVDGDWVVLGKPESIDPGSGTTPDEYLAALREDVGGATLRRITYGMRGLTTSRLEDGSTVYRGASAAGLIARDAGFKGGESIRLLPFGFVAHGEAADPVAPLDTAVTVGADGIVREIAVTWGTAASAWTYTVAYSNLGATAAPVAPANARPLRDRWPAGAPRARRDGK